MFFFKNARFVCAQRTKTNTDFFARKLRVRGGLYTRRRKLCAMKDILLVGVIYV